jgi:hypothetical protein
MSIDIVELRRVLAEEAERSADEKTEEEQEKAADKERREQEDIQPFTITATDFVSEKIRHLLDSMLKYAGEKGKAALKERTGLDVDTIKKTLASKNPVAAAQNALNDLKTKAQSAAAVAKQKVGSVADGVKEAGNKATAEANTAVTAAQTKVDTAKKAVTSQIDNTTQNRSNDDVRPSAARRGAATARRQRNAAIKEKIKSLKELGNKMDSDLSTAKGNVAARLEAKSKSAESYKFAGRDQTVESLKTKIQRIQAVAKQGTVQERAEAVNQLQALKEKLQPTKAEPPKAAQPTAPPEPATRTDPFYRSPTAEPAGSEDL